jgi:hypothetical protein
MCKATRARAKTKKRVRRVDVTQCNDAVTSHNTQQTTKVAHRCHTASHSSPRVAALARRSLGSPPTAQRCALLGRLAAAPASSRGIATRQQHCRSSSTQPLHTSHCKSIDVTLSPLGSMHLKAHASAPKPQSHKARAPHDRARRTVHHTRPPISHRSASIRSQTHRIRQYDQRYCSPQSSSDKRNLASEKKKKKKNVHRQTHRSIRRAKKLSNKYDIDNNKKHKH